MQSATLFFGRLHSVRVDDYVVWLLLGVAAMGSVLLLG